MGAKAEIGWKGRTVEGEKREVYAQHVGDRWKFYERGKRYDQWQAMPEPPLEDWLELLDAVQRMINRRRLQPEHEELVRRRIRERFPAANLPEPT